MDDLFDNRIPVVVREMVMNQLSGPPGTMQLIINKIGSDGSIAIPEKDFPLLKSCTTIVGNAVGAGTLIGWAPAAISALIVLLFEFRRRRIDLSVAQGRILRELRAHPGLTASQIVEGLALPESEVPSVQDQLEQLQQMRAEDNCTIKLVSKDSRDRWYLEGV